MSKLLDHIYIERDKFFFDAEIYNEGMPSGFLDYEDGDMIKWIWEGKKMTGILREENSNLNLFSIENITVY